MKGIASILVAIVAVSAVFYLVSIREPATEVEANNIANPAARERAVVATQGDTAANRATEETVAKIRADIQAAERAAAQQSTPAMTEIETAANSDNAVPVAPESQELAAPEDMGAMPEEGESLLAMPAVFDVDAPKALEDRVMGNPNAPVTIVEYASLTCPHCAQFHTEVLPELKKALIETGKAKLIFRDFPLDNFALRASMMARCATPDKYFNLLEVIFQNQLRWTKSSDPLAALAQLGTLAGMDKNYVSLCMKNAELEAGLLRRVQDAQSNYRIKSTPTFVLNNGAEIISGAHELKDFINAINRLPKK